MKKEQLKEAVGELNLVDTVFEADGVSYIDTAVSVMQVYDLIDQLDEPEKIMIPQFVADWWERDADFVTMYGRLRVEKKHKFDLVSIFYDKGLGDYLSKVEDWIYENNSIFLDLINGKPYEVEEEQRYYVLLPEIVDNWRYVSLAPNHWGVTVRYTDTLDDVHEFTEKEIKDYDPRYWQFAVEVAE